MSDNRIGYARWATMRIDTDEYNDPDKRYYTVRGGGVYAYIDKGQIKRRDEK